MKQSKGTQQQQAQDDLDKENIDPANKYKFKQIFNNGTGKLFPQSQTQEIQMN